MEPHSESEFAAEAAGKEERTWAMLCHLSAMAGYLIPMGHIFGPLLIWLLKREAYPLVDDQGKESLNFQISVTLYMVVGILLIAVLVGIALLIGLVVFQFIMVVVATAQADSGVRFRYPMTLRLIK